MQENMDSFSRIAEQIRSNGKELLEKKGIVSLAKEYGKIVYTGSYALDLMVWNDIDIQILAHENIDQRKAFTTIMYQVLQDPECNKCCIINSNGTLFKELPRGLYLGLEFVSPDLGGYWKVDLWFLEPKEYEKNVLFMERLKAILTPSLRSLILEIKTQLRGEGNRVPPLASYELYCIILDGARSKEEILEQLRDRGCL